jgi:hypothetical protein
MSQRQVSSKKMDTLKLGEHAFTLLVTGKLGRYPTSSEIDALRKMQEEQGSCKKRNNHS